ncbi:transposase, partial [Escherichia coli]|uniref:transposase n=1 Tax=Escherichia coli TaxID=562 RepID=UPI003892BAB6
MTKTVSTSKKPRKQHSPEFRSEALKLAERIGVTAAARELSLYESQLYNWRSKQQNQQTSSERELEMSTEIARLKRQLAERDEELAILQKAVVDSICQCNTPFNYLFRCFELQCLSR